jgi:Na+/alanine symporter
MICSTEKGSGEKRNWLKQYSQQEPARSATIRFTRVLIDTLLIGCGVQSQIVHKGIDGGLAQLG